MVDGIRGHGVKAVQVLKKQWTMKTASDKLAGIEYFTQCLSYARKARCNAFGSFHKLPVSGSLDGKETAQTFCCGCMHFTSLVCHTEDYADIDFLEPAFALGSVPSDTPFRLRGSISRAQLLSYIERVKAGKAVEFDGFHAEFLRDAPPAFINLLLHWINLLLEGSVMIDEYWLLGQIKFLFKGKEPATWLKHWRPICLLKLMYRLFSLILNDSLMELVERHNLLEGTQEGFRAGKGTGRQAQSLAWIYEEARRKGSRLYVIFADFVSAFDSVDHRALFIVLRRMGIPDVDLIESLYRSSPFRVTTTFGDTAKVLVTRGARQGDILSPLIFDIFIDVLLPLFSLSSVGTTCSAGEKANNKAFADDTALLASTAGGAQDLLAILARFCDW
eukprot:3937844-Rhodomonas_salina.1